MCVCVFINRRVIFFILSERSIYDVHLLPTAVIVLQKILRFRSTETSKGRSLQIHVIASFVNAHKQKKNTLEQQKARLSSFKFLSFIFNRKNILCKTTQITVQFRVFYLSINFSTNLF